MYDIDTKRIDEVISTIEKAEFEQIKQFAHAGFSVHDKAMSRGIWNRTMMVALDSNRTGVWYNAKNMVVILCKPYPKGFPMLEHSIWCALRAAIIYDLKDHTRLKENDLDTLMEAYVGVFGRPIWMDSKL